MNFISTFDELNKLYEEKTENVEEACAKEELVEAVEDEEIEIVEDEPKQTIIECSKCGALVIVDEVEIDEESDLVNVKDECKFCEEKEGYKIIGSVVPYEVPEISEEEAEVFEEEPVEEPAEDDMVEDGFIEEGLEHAMHKKLDKPYSIEAQQQLEAELNGECGEISDKRRKEIENIFAWQRDWEARHNVKEELEEDEKELEELLDFSVPVSVNANGNSVAVGGVA